MTFYLCDMKAHCGGSVGCVKNGGNCKHTTQPDHAIRGECLNPSDHPERFEAEKFDINPNGDTTTYYWEKEEKLDETSS